MRSNRLLLILGLALAFVLGGWLSLRLLAPKPKPVEEATVLLEKIRQVFKLVTVEGQFSEVYNYNEYQGYFTWLYDKKVLVRVRATVSAGYDLTDIDIRADSVNRVLQIGPIPGAQILSIDHTLDYYDISEGIFTSFSPEDYNRINKQAKDLIRDQAGKGELLQAAEEQADKIFDLVRFMGESSGWRVEILRDDGSLLQ